MYKNFVSFLVIILCFMALFIGKDQQSLKTTKKIETKNVSTITENFSKNKIVLIPFSGVIEPSSTDSGFFQAEGAQGIIDALKKVQKDNSVKAVIIKLNTPGGTVALSQSIYDTLIDVRKNKPIVVAMDDVAASGGYYIASAADRIVAQRGTLTGSVGVIFSTLDIHKLLNEKLAIKSNVIKSGKFKDIGSGLKPMSEDERELLQDIIDDSYAQFIADIVKGRIKRNDKYTAEKRDLTIENLKKYADGRIFTGNQAYEYGFVDVLGNLDVAHSIAESMAIERFKLTEKKLPLELYNNSNLFKFTGNFFQSKIEHCGKFIPKSVQLSKQPLYLWE